MLIGLFFLPHAGAERVSHGSLQATCSRKQRYYMSKRLGWEEFSSVCIQPGQQTHYRLQSWPCLVPESEGVMHTKTYPHGLTRAGIVSHVE